MRQPVVRRGISITVAVFIVTLVAGCSRPKLDGMYDDANGDSIEFIDGKAIFSAPGVGGLKADYSVTGNNLTIEDPTNVNNSYTFTINSDGSLSGAIMGISNTFKRRS